MLKNTEKIAPFVRSEGKVSWSSPSNIALVKYWGKKGIQVPANPSLSMTLDRSVTTMEVGFNEIAESRVISLDFSFEGEKNLVFEDKIRTYLESLAQAWPWLHRVHLEVKSANTFPHSAGIASSASSMSALALCLVSLRQEVFGPEQEPDIYREASDLARQASGSACRSLYGGYTVWGALEEVQGTDDRFAIPLPREVHPSFRNLKDAILMVSSARKSVSSRAGHDLMNGHPFAEARYQMATRNVADLVTALTNGDTEAFIRITEQEALTLHGLMMSSRDPFLLLQPNSLALMERIRQYRQETEDPVCFTIDAGPNIHLLYPEDRAARIRDWINSELSPWLENGRWIEDGMGSGPVKLNE